MSNNSLSDLSVKQLKRAVKIRERLDGLQAELASILGDSSEGAKVKNGRRKMSASARARIGAAQRLRWARHRKGLGAKAGAPKGRRKMSAAARAKISRAAKARWAKAKAENRNSLANP